RRRGARLLIHNFAGARQLAQVLLDLLAADFRQALVAEFWRYVQPEQLLIAALRGGLALEVGVGPEPLLGILLEYRHRLAALVQKREIAKGESCFDLAPHALCGFLAAARLVFAPAVVVHVYVPLAT